MKRGHSVISSNDCEYETTGDTNMLPKYRMTSGWICGYCEFENRDDEELCAICANQQDDEACVGFSEIVFNMILLDETPIQPAKKQKITWDSGIERTRYFNVTDAPNVYVFDTKDLETNETLCSIE